MSVSSRARTALGALGIAALFAVASLPRTAMAQDGGNSATGTNGLSITINGVVNRFYPNGTTSYNFRAANLNPYDINFQDCSDDIILQFYLTLGGLPTTDTLQVWAGSTDCSQPSARETGSGPYCWQVASRGEFADTMTSSGNIYVRNITQYLDDTTTGHFAPVTEVPGIGACHTQTTSGAVALSLYFMFIANDGITVDDSLTYGQNVDMVGPLPPSLTLPIGIGDGLLLLNWAPQIDSTIQGFNIYAQDQGPSGLGVGAEAGAAVQVTPIYCHSGSSEICPDASVSTDASLDATLVDSGGCVTSFSDASAYTEVPDSSTLAALSDTELAAMGCERGTPVNTVTSQTGAATCTSTALVNLFTTSVTNTTSVDSGFVDGATSIISAVDGESISGTAGVGISNINYSTYGVGNVGGNTTSSYTITSIAYPDGGSGPLIDGHQYAIAVAAYDDDGNIGIISNLGCQTPEPVTDFWDKYREDGGLAGGSFCSLEAPGAPVAGSVFGLGFGTALVAFGRRRRRRTS